MPNGVRFIDSPLEAEITEASRNKSTQIEEERLYTAIAQRPGKRDTHTSRVSSTQLGHTRGTKCTRRLLFKYLF
jgi:hypothetical protein